MQRMPETIIVYYEKSQSYIIAQTYGCPLSDIHYFYILFFFFFPRATDSSNWEQEQQYGHLKSILATWVSTNSNI